MFNIPPIVALWVLRPCTLGFSNNNNVSFYHLSDRDLQNAKFTGK